MLADETLGKGASKSADTQGLRKSEKSLSIGARMADHDLSSRLKNIIKWLNKRHEVRILIQGSVNGADEGNAERIVKAIEMTIKEPQVIGKIVQKRQKGSYIKFNIIPLAAAAETEASTVKELWQPMGFFMPILAEKPPTQLFPLLGNLDTAQVWQNYSTSQNNFEGEPEHTKSIIVAFTSVLFMFAIKYTFWLRKFGTTELIIEDDIDADERNS